MQSRPDPRLRVVLPNLEHAAGCLDLCPNTPPGDECAREGGITEVDREGVIRHAARPRGRHRPAIRPAILIEPSGDLGMPLAETRWRNADPDADEKAPFGGRDHLARVAWHRVPLSSSGRAGRASACL